MPIRVFVDWNDQDEDGRLWLDLTLSVKDLAPFSESLREGTLLILYWEPEDPEFVYENDGVLERNSQGRWVARPIGASRTLPKIFRPGQSSMPKP